MLEAARLSLGLLLGPDTALLDVVGLSLAVSLPASLAAARIGPSNPPAR